MRFKLITGKTSSKAFVQYEFFCFCVPAMIIISLSLAFVLEAQWLIERAHQYQSQIIQRIITENLSAQAECFVDEFERSPAKTNWIHPWSQRRDTKTTKPWPAHVYFFAFNTKKSEVFSGTSKDCLGLPLPTKPSYPYSLDL